MHIVLSSGQNASQPMISWQQSGTLETQKLKALELWTELTQLNQPAVRVKIEALEATLRHRPGTQKPSGTVY